MCHRSRCTPSCAIGESFRNQPPLCAFYVDAIRIVYKNFENRYLGTETGVKMTPKFENLIKDPISMAAGPRSAAL
jgi:hypothetical protein